MTDPFQRVWRLFEEVDRRMRKTSIGIEEAQKALENRRPRWHPVVA
jgi:hypothetical protein